MNTPSKEAFDEWFVALESGENEKIVERVSRQSHEMDASQIREMAPELLALMFDNDDRHRRMLGHLEVWKWISSKVAFNSAHKMMHRRARPETSDGFVATSMEHLVSSEDDAKVRLRLYRILRSMILKDSAWDAMVVQAVYDYLYVDLNSLHAARRTALPKLQKAEELLREAVRAMEPELGADSAAVVFRKIDWWISKARRVPSRDQANKRERQFVKQIALVNESLANRTMKPQVIAELMSMEIFERRFDLRTISRICAEIAQQRHGRRAATMARREAIQHKDAMATARQLA